MKAKRYPGADTSRFYGSGRYSGLDQSDLDKIVLHSTETSARWGCPGYSGGANAPTFTINPWPGYERVWQHFDANESARALLNPGSTPVSENRDEVCQIEIIGYSDARTAKTYGYDLRNLPDSGYAYIAKVIAWIMKEWTVPLVFPSSWPAYPASYGNSSARMSSATYDKFSGILGHLHVSGNLHGDPTISVSKLKAAIQKELGSAAAVPAPAPATRPTVSTPRPALAEDGLWGPNTCRALQRWVGVARDGVMGRNTIKALQRKVGSTPDGVLGRNTVKALQRKVGSTADGVWPRTRRSDTTLKLQKYLNRNGYRP